MTATLTWTPCIPTTATLKMEMLAPQLKLASLPAADIEMI
jgi:hypothetical protein